MITTILVAIAWWGFVACAIYLLAMAMLFAGTLLAAIRENRLRARESRVEDLDTLRVSPFSIPVSVIAPAFNEESCVVPAVQSLLALDYPEFEVIVVNDGSTDATLARLRAAFDLEPTGTFYRHRLPSGDIRQIYRSRRVPRLLVVDKVNGGKADALNCGLNLARYRYVCCVDGDTVYYPDALLKGMRLAMADPATVVGVTSQVEVSSHPERMAPARDSRRHDRHPLVVYQMFDYLRAFVGTRLAWSRGNYMLCSVGAFAIWRRDVVLDLGGFSRRFTCEDIEFTFRVHEHFRAAGEPYRILALPDPVGVTEAPTGVRGLVAQRARWQRVITETVWHYRHMLFGRRYGTVGWIGMPHYVLGEVLSPVFQLLAVLLVPIAVAAGLMHWAEFAYIVAIIALGAGVFTVAALFVQERNLRPFATRELPYLLLLAPLELFLYRPIIAFAQWQGMVGFLRGHRGWDKFARNARA
jgi:poly-beta-1,6-N-acetyl-D-glucosamine synthase